MQAGWAGLRGSGEEGARRAERCAAGGAGGRWIDGGAASGCWRRAASGRRGRRAAWSPEEESLRVYLKALTLRGFKSFASATSLRFERGITSVVGPNGSGKSNVVDAFSWVMGEQGVKPLRGGKMEDVLFAATSPRPPPARPHAPLTIDTRTEP